MKARVIKIKNEYGAELLLIAFSFAVVALYAYIGSHLIR